MPSFDETALDRTERLARAVGRVRRAMLASATKAVERKGESLLHWQLVSAIAHDGLHSQVALARRLAIDPAATSRALDEIEKLGLVVRERDGVDRRRFNVSLTAKGGRWYETMRRVVFAELAPMFAPLSASEAKRLVASLDKIATSVVLAPEEAGYSRRRPGA